MTSFINARDAWRIADDSHRKNEEIKYESLSLKFNWIWALIKDASLNGHFFVETQCALSLTDEKSLISMLRYYGYKVTSTPTRAQVGETFTTWLDVRWS